MTVIDLSDLKGKPEAGPTIDALSEEDQAAVEALAADNPEPEGEPVHTAFLVIVGKDGSVGVMPDLDFAVIRDSLPTMGDIYSASVAIAKDVQVQETAMATAQAMTQMAQAQMQQLQAQQLASRLDLPKSH